MRRKILSFIIHYILFPLELQEVQEKKLDKSSDIFLWSSFHRDHFFSARKRSYITGLFQRKTFLESLTFRFLFAKIKVIYHVDWEEITMNYSFDGKSYRINGKRVWLHVAEIHYFRFAAKEWRRAMNIAKAAGCNTISTYAAWNYHETSEGVWDFSGD